MVYQTLKMQLHRCFATIYLFFKSIIISFMMIYSIEIYSQDNIVLCQLSARVGDEIDRQERDYFCLFPDFTDFESARFYRLSYDSIKIEIKQANQTAQTTTMLIITEQEMQKVTKYINEFEQILNTHNKLDLQNVNPQLINFHAALRKSSRILKKYNDGELNRFTVIDSENKQFSGLVLYANDSLVFLWNESIFYNWRKISDNSKLLFDYEIEKIIIEREGSFLSGAGTGFLIGGGIGAIAGLLSGSDTEGIIQFSAGTKALFGGLTLGTTFGLIGGILGASQGTDDELYINCDEMLYKKSVQILKENAVFPIHAPPEILCYLQNDKYKSIQHSSGKNEDKEPENYESDFKPIHVEKNRSVESDSDDNNTKFHISFMLDYTNTAANNDIIDALKQSGFGGNIDGWFGNVDYPVDHSNIITWHIESSYSFFSNFRFGLGVKNIAQQEISGTNGVSEFTEGYSYNFFADWIVDPYKLYQLDRWEYMIGVGVTYNNITVKRSIGYFNNNKFTEKNFYGLQIRSGLDYYPLPNLSFQIKLMIDVLPSININEFKSQDVEEVIKQHSINFSGVDISAGIRFHL